MDRPHRTDGTSPVDKAPCSVLHILKGLQHPQGCNAPAERTAVDRRRWDKATRWERRANLQKPFEIGRITGEMSMVPLAFDDKAP
jgi:hypothetical protein